MASRRIGPFEVGTQLGVGGMGIVYLATYLKTGQQCALKVLTPGMSAAPDLVRRFEREMEILKKLRHKHIVRYFGGGRSGSQHYYAMELIDGGTLEDVLKKRGRLSWEQTIEVCLQVCRGLEHAHNHAIVHRDLKPANLFITKKGRVKIGDFGIARDTQATALTAAGKTVGTYAYMAPEQISGKPPVSRRTDLYALGCVMYEILTGEPPFRADTPAEMLMQHLKDDPPRVTATAIDCPTPLEDVIFQLMEKDPEERYYDALAVQVALEEVGEKVRQQASITAQTMEGSGRAATAADGAALKKLVGGKKKKKKKRRDPVYERGWFLAVCLTALIGLVTWGLWPLSEDELFARAQPLMQSEDHLDWNTAREKYLEPLLERFPDSRHSADARAFILEIDMERAERQARVRAERGLDPKSEAERQFIQAWRLARFGDRITAIEKYLALIQLFDDQTEERIFVHLSRREVERLQQQKPQKGGPVGIVNSALHEAHRNFLAGRVGEAHDAWHSIVTLYSNYQELAPQVQFAREQMAGSSSVEPVQFVVPVEEQDEPPAPATAGSSS